MAILNPMMTDIMNIITLCFPCLNLLHTGLPDHPSGDVVLDLVIVGLQLVQLGQPLPQRGCCGYNLVVVVTKLGNVTNHWVSKCDILLLNIVVYPVLDHIQLKLLPQGSACLCDLAGGAAQTPGALSRCIGFKETHLRKLMALEQTALAMVNDSVESIKPQVLSVHKVGRSPHHSCRAKDCGWLVDERMMTN